MAHATGISSDTIPMDDDALSIRFLYRPIVFLEPERVVSPPSWLDYTPFAFWIIDALRPSNLVELGCHSGNSYASFAQAVQTLGLPAACYAVDTWQGDPHAGFFDETVFEEWSGYHDRRFSAFSRLIRATFDEAVEHFADGSIDLLHIDGYHTFEAVSHDFETWRSKLSPRGVVLCHDINVREKDFGAWRLWDRLRDEFPCFEFLHGSGLGVLGIGHDLPDAVRWLLSLRAQSPEAVNIVRLFFSRLGAAVLNRYAAAEHERAVRAELTSRDEQLAHLTTEAATLGDSLKAAEDALVTRTVDAEQLASSLGSRDAQLARGAEEAARLESEITSLQERVSTLSNDLNVRNGWLAHATDAVATLKGELAESERRLTAVQTDASRLSEALSVAEEAIAIRTADAERRSASLRARDAELEEGTHEIARLVSTISGLRKRINALSAALDARDAQIAHLKRDVEAIPRALGERDRIIRGLDGEASAAVEHLRRETDRLHQETTRRRSFEAVLTWAQGQVAELSHREASQRTGLLSELRTLSRALGMAVRSAGWRTEVLARSWRIASRPRRLRDFRVIEASLLFDEAYYLKCHPRAAASGSALLHFVLEGEREGCDPHPLFSTSYYTGQIYEVARGSNAFRHYLTRGWRTGCAPHPLFDPAYYLAQNPDAAREGGNPLKHYLEQGASARRSPHPLFDIDFYLRENPDVVDKGIDPLIHFLVTGAREGRRPNPWFDCAYYLEANPDVAADDRNPLAHFIQFGWREGRKPSTAFDVEDYLARYPDVRASGENPLVHYVLHGRAQGRPAIGEPHHRPSGERRNGTSRIELRTCSLAPHCDNQPTVVVVSHVGPERPRAGNEYRVRRMLCWYQKQGYRIIPIIAPLPGEELTRESLERTAGEFGNAVQCHRDGSVEYILRAQPDVLASLNGMFTSSFADLLGEEVGASAREHELLHLERLFCHDTVISAVLHLQRALGPHVLQVEYIWMTRLLPLVRGNVLKVVDTHDVFSSIQQKVTLFGLRDIVIEPHEEADRLGRADLALAIQDDERAELMRLAPSVPVITAGVDFDVVGDGGGRAATAQNILYVASNNPRNRKGLDDFLSLAWPRIHRVVPQAELLVLGTVADALATRAAPGVRAIGPVDDLTAWYPDAALVINPAVAGTGLKIKILEALCHFRPVVTWPTGVEGLDPRLAARCLVVRDWYEFSEQVISVLTRPPGGWFTADDRSAIAELVAPEHVYASVDSAFRAFFDQHARAAEAVGVMARTGGSPTGTQ
jgi:hypothetical protein